jgi:hypothetical protein
LQAGTMQVDGTTFTVTVTFAVPQSGRLVLVPAGTVSTPPSPTPPSPTPLPVSSAGGLPLALQRMLVDTIQHAPYLGQDPYGKPTYGPFVVRPARLEYVTQVIPSGGGQERTSQSVVFLNGDVPSVTARDQIRLPDGTAPAIQTVRSVRQPFAPLAISHYELLL